MVTEIQRQDLIRVRMYAHNSKTEQFEITMTPALYCCTTQTW